MFQNLCKFWWTQGYAFPPFSLISRVLHKVLIGQATLILKTSIANPILVPSVTKALNSKPFGFAQSPRFVTKPKQGTSSSKNKRKGYLQKEYQRNLPLLSHMPDDQAQSLFTNRPGISGIADVLGDKLIQLNAL